MMDKRVFRIAFMGDSLTEAIVGASYFEILRQKLPQHELFNFGKGGDTVISLFRRLQEITLKPSVDIGFLWVGVNDVFVKTRWSLALSKRLRGQPWAKSHTQFQDCYRTLLEFLLDKITYVYTIPPLLIGEDIDNDWNKELTILSKIIRDLSISIPNVEFVDLREHFISPLASKNITPYVPKSVFRVIWDAISAKIQEDWGKKASERGLHFTIDGVHLNKAGAEKVADVLLEKLHSKIRFTVGDT